MRRGKPGTDRLRFCGECWVWSQIIAAPQPITPYSWIRRVVFRRTAAPKSATPAPTRKMSAHDVPVFGNLGRRRVVVVVGVGVDVVVVDDVVVVEAPGAVEVVEAPGAVEVVEPPGTVEVVEPPGRVEVVEPPGTVEVVEPPGTVEVVEPPGTVEVVEPPGTVKVVVDGAMVVVVCIVGQSPFVMVLVSSVTAPFRASSCPWTVAPVFAVMDVMAKM